MLVRTIGSTVLGGVGIGLGSKVETHVAALKQGAVLLVVCLLRSLGGLEINVAEATRPAALLVSDDTGTDKALVDLELLIKDVVVNAPAEVANPEGGALVLAGGSLLRVRSLFRLLLGLSLLGRLLLNLLLLLLARLGIIGVRVAGG